MPYHQELWFWTFGFVIRFNNTLGLAFYIISEICVLVLHLEGIYSSTFLEIRINIATMQQCELLHM